MDITGVKQPKVPSKKNINVDALASVLREGLFVTFRWSSIDIEGTKAVTQQTVSQHGAPCSRLSCISSEFVLAVPSRSGTVKAGSPKQLTFLQPVLTNH